jgi:hypothetical protein
MNSRLMISCRQFRSVDNFSSWPSAPWIAISLCIAHQVGEFRFDRQSGEGVALQSSMPKGAASVCLPREGSTQHGHSGDLRRS